MLEEAGRVVELGRGEKIFLVKAVMSDECELCTVSFYQARVRTMRTVKPYSGTEQILGKVDSGPDRCSMRSGFDDARRAVVGGERG